MFLFQFVLFDLLFDCCIPDRLGDRKEIDVFLIMRLGINLLSSGCFLQNSLFLRWTVFAADVHISASYHLRIHEGLWSSFSLISSLKCSSTFFFPEKKFQRSFSCGKRTFHLSYDWNRVQIDRAVSMSV